jgi:hypothetical protein
VAVLKRNNQSRELIQKKSDKICLLSHFILQYQNIRADYNIIVYIYSVNIKKMMNIVNKEYSSTHSSPLSWPVLNGISCEQELDDT